MENKQQENPDREVIDFRAHVSRLSCDQDLMKPIVVEALVQAPVYLVRL